MSGRWLIGCVAAILAAAPAHAQDASSIPLGPAELGGNRIGLAVSPDGTANVAWVEDPGLVKFCRVAVGASACGATTTIRNKADRVTVEIMADGRPTLFTDCFTCYHGGRQTQQWVTTDGGATFVERQAGATRTPGNPWVIGSGVAPAHHADYDREGDRYFGLDSGNFDAMPGGPDPTADDTWFRLSPYPPGTSGGDTLAIAGSGHHAVAAFSGPAGIQERHLPAGADPDSPAAWSPAAPVEATPGLVYLAGNAAHGAGLFLLETKDTYSVQWRTWDPVAGAFGPPVDVATGNDAYGADLAADRSEPDGRFHVAWAGVSKFVYSTSTASGSRWSAPISLRWTRVVDDVVISGNEPGRAWIATSGGGQAHLIPVPAPPDAGEPGGDGPGGGGGGGDDPVPGGPVARISSPLSAIPVDTTVVFSGAASSGSGLSYAWTVDGAPAAGAERLSTAFSSGGRHTVGLTVRDGAGRAHTAERAITVVEPPAMRFRASDANPVVGRDVNYELRPAAAKALRARAAAAGPSAGSTAGKGGTSFVTAQPPGGAPTGDVGGFLEMKGLLVGASGKLDMAFSKPGTFSVPFSHRSTSGTPGMGYVHSVKARAAGENAMKHTDLIPDFVYTDANVGRAVHFASAVSLGTLAKKLGIDTQASFGKGKFKISGKSLAANVDFKVRFEFADGKPAQETDRFGTVDHVFDTVGEHKVTMIISSPSGKELVRSSAKIPVRATNCGAISLAGIEARVAGEGCWLQMAEGPQGQPNAWVSEKGRGVDVQGVTFQPPSDGNLIVVPDQGLLFPWDSKTGAVVGAKGTLLGRINYVVDFKKKADDAVLGIKNKVIVPIMGLGQKVADLPVVGGALAFAKGEPVQIGPVLQLPEPMGGKFALTVTIDDLEAALGGEGALKELADDLRDLPADFPGLTAAYADAKAALAGLDQKAKAALAQAQGQINQLKSKLKALEGHVPPAVKDAVGNFKKLQKYVKYLKNFTVHHRPDGRWTFGAHVPLGNFELDARDTWPGRTPGGRIQGLWLKAGGGFEGAGAHLTGDIPIPPIFKITRFDAAVENRENYFLMEGGIQLGTLAEVAGKQLIQVDGCANVVISESTPAPPEIPLCIRQINKQNYRPPTSGETLIHVAGELSILAGMAKLAGAVGDYHSGGDGKDAWFAFEGDMTADYPPPPSPVAGLLTVKGHFGAEISASGTWNAKADIGVCPRFLDAITGCPTGQVRASHSGIGACVLLPSIFLPDVGGWYRWTDGAGDIIWSSCDIGAVERTIGGFAARASAADHLRDAGQPIKAFGAAASATVKLESGPKWGVVGATGQSAAPRVAVVFPDGKRVEHDGSPLHQAVVGGRKVTFVRSTPLKTTFAFVASPQEGDYKVETVAGSAPLVQVRSASTVPEPTIAAETKMLRDGRVEVRWKESQPSPGEEVSFVEQDLAGKDVFADIGKNASIARRTRRTRGTLRFTPAFGPGGKRRIIAIVSRHGIPVHSEVVATYTAPKLIIPKKPRRLKVKRFARSAVVRWRRSKGATAYDVTLSLSDGRTISKRVKARRIRVPRVARALDARVEVLPRGRQTITGSPAQTLSKGKAPRPRVVRLRA